LVGEPGVGKTALAEGLAQKIASADVPPHLRDAELYLLDMGAMLAGARYRGDFENRMKAIFQALEKKPNAIMMIDEIHTIVGAGATAGSSMDASNMLKPILSKGTIRCIGSTTYKEYRSYFEKDRALARRFQKIDVEEPSEEESNKILLGLKKRYEEFHGVKISDEAIKLAVSLSKRYLHERKLPDKAIDLIDEACARLRLLDNAKELAVDENAIAEAVASMAHIPSQKINQDDKELLSHLESTLKKNVFGQDHAIETVTNAILLARAGLRDQEKPIGCFLFTGPSGVGKTEVARQIALALGNNLVRFDMSEYMERHAASRLVGAPPGYVGFEQGGLLTDAIHKTPYAVLLLDEIEKAHPDVFNMLLQVMDYGKLTDSNGRTTDFRHVILIMTSNAGARELEQRLIGFMGAQEGNASAQVIKNLFAPEFRNRLDARVAFNKLSGDVIREVVHKFINELKAQLVPKNVGFSISAQAIRLLAEQGFDPTMGARPLARLIQEEIKKPLAHELLFGQLTKGGSASIDVKEGKISIDAKGF
ncbi:MAG TPA: AAA family ATPase, partial [Myxococcota bacterium]|nr:AAA family ATPase [Myxococcota bacterium]